MEIAGQTLDERQLENEITCFSFSAMASPCEILFANANHKHVISVEALRSLALKMAAEALRIERKFSRYRDDNLIYRLNQGEKVKLDDESTLLFDYANTLFEESDGLFDISSGSLRKLWDFGAGFASGLPSQKSIEEQLVYISWDKVSLQAPYLQLPAGFEIDLGGIGKEYAVDRAYQIFHDACSLYDLNLDEVPVLINFGGDIFTNKPPTKGSPWQVAIESPSDTQNVEDAQALAKALLELSAGGLATSGTSKRSIEFEGKVYGHLLNPKTGWPIENAPRSVTVVASSCLQAGSLSSLAMLCGEEAETFLANQDVPFWVYR